MNRLSAELASKGYNVKTIICSTDLDMFNIVYSDLFILMGEALLEIAKDCGCAISKAILDDMGNFWDEGTEISVSKEEETTSVEAGISEKDKYTFK